MSLSTELARAPYAEMRERTVFSSLAPFLRDLASFAGARGIKALLLVFLGAVVEGMGLLLLVPFLSIASGGQSVPGTILIAANKLFLVVFARSRFEKLSLLIALFVALMLARAVIITLRDVTMKKLDLGFVQEIRSRLTKRLGQAEWSVISRLRHSRITQIMGSDIFQLSRATYVVFADTTTLVMLASQIAIAFYLSPTLASLAIVSVAVGVVTLLPMLRRARDVGDYTATTNLSLLHDLGQFLGALKLAVSQNLQSNFTREFDRVLGDLTDKQVAFTRRQTSTRLAVTTIASLVGAAAVILGIILNVPVPILITLVVIFSRMNGPALQLHGDLQMFVQALPAYEKIRDLEHDLAASRSFDADAATAPDAPDGAIEFRDVTFLHDEKEGTRLGGVHSINATIEPHSIVGITGPSGAGKTTLTDLLVALYPPQQGAITVGGIALRGPVVRAWRNAISYVAQDAFLFHDTIRRNLLWGNDDRDERDVWDALELVGAADFVRRNSQGLETIVGERGSLLSGGERQRLSLARAILRRPRLLVLDEATNAIDVEGERALLQQLVRLPFRPTIVIVAHRPDSLQFCNRLFIVEKGSVTSEEGRDGIVARLRDLTSNLHSRALEDVAR